MRRHVILAAALVPSGAAMGAVPSALTQVAGGVWEVSGVPGAQQPIRQCFADIMRLAQFEHRGRNCSRTVLSDRGGTALIDYRCGPSDFGESQIDVLTPRSLRIATQGISDRLPFNYVIQARRVGDCAKSPYPPSH